jgi:hypothetical protein
MRAELAARENAGRSSDAVRRGAARPVDDEDEGRDQRPLPELDELVARIPADVRETLGELFRARFVSVKKLPKRFFQASSSRAGDEPEP